jgi:hypothetical protein
MRVGRQMACFDAGRPLCVSEVLSVATVEWRETGSTLRGAASLNAEAAAVDAGVLVEDDAELRTRILSIGLPILLPDGKRVLRGAEVKVAPEPGTSPEPERLVQAGWVDLRPGNWVRWRVRAEQMLATWQGLEGADAGSRADLEPWQVEGRVRPGAMAAWVLRREDRGERIKR